MEEAEREISASKKALLRSSLSPKVRTLLIKGEPGSGKTTLALELLKEFGRGVYISSRVSGDMLLEQNRQLRDLVERGVITSLSVSEYTEKSSSYKFEDFRLASIEDVLMSILGRSGNERRKLNRAGLLGFDRGKTGIQGQDQNRTISLGDCRSKQGETRIS